MKQITRPSSSHLASRLSPRGLHGGCPRPAGLLLLLLIGCSRPSAPAVDVDEADPAPAPAAPSVDAPADWVDLVGARIAASGYVIKDRDGALHANNPGQRFSGDWDQQGLRVTPFGRPGGGPDPSSSKAWELSLRTTSWGRAGAMKSTEDGPPRLGSCRADGAIGVDGDCLRRVERAGPGITEWFENRVEGLEQGWTIEAPPSGVGPLLVEIAVGGMDASVTAQGDAARLSGDGGFLSYSDLVAWDANDRPLNAWLEPREGGLAIAVDDAGATWPITIDPILSSEGWSVEGSSYSELMGHAVASAGDVDGDGYSDVLVSAPAANLVQSNHGVVYLFAGSATGLSTTAAWIGEGDTGNAEYGYSAASAGDVNGDGYSDVVVGAHQWSTNGGNEGKAYVYLGSATGLATSASWSVEGTQPGGWFGRAVSSAGDVNGDGYSDIAVGAVGWNGAGSSLGRATLYLGSASGVSTSAVWSAEGQQNSAYFGSALAGAGDVNGDGYDDLVVGAPNASNPEANEGVAYLYLGSASGPSTTADWTGELNNPGAEYGASVAGAGDVNGDGYADLLVGSPSMGTFDSGQASLYLGSVSGPASTPSWSLSGVESYSKLGRSVGTAGDVNGDGYADVIIGQHEWYYFDHNQRQGRAQVFMGSASGLGWPEDWSANEGQINSDFGWSVSAAGDVDGDGYSDVLVGARAYDGAYSAGGAAFLYLGSTGGLGTTSAWSGEPDQAEAQMGVSVSSAGDVNADGFGDVIVGAPGWSDGEANEGAAFLYEGSGSGLLPTPSWTGQSNQADAAYGEAVAGAGDVNGDGYSDVLVGAGDYDGSEVDEGRAYLYLGSASGLELTAAWTVDGGQEDADLGSVLAGGGDVNGDGYDDVVIGAPLYDNGQTDEGQAWFFPGSPTGLASAPSMTWESDQATAYLGSGLAILGDTNGDGFGEVAVGASDFDDAHWNEGIVHVYTGSLTGPSSTPSWSVQSDWNDTHLGSVVEPGGDVNGDGYADLLLGAPLYSNPANGEGAVWLYAGSASGLESAPAWFLESNWAGLNLGTSVASIGDTNGDGYDDVVVGAPLTAGQGRAYLYLGSATGLTDPQELTFLESQPAGNLFGLSVSAAGDVDGDGYGDLIVGAPGYDGGETDEGGLFLYRGNSGDGSTAAALPPVPQALQPTNGARILPGGRSTSTDSFVASVSALSPFGRGDVKLEVEVKPVGTPFDGTDTLISSNWIDTGLTGVELELVVSSLTPETAYRWRARLRFDPVRGQPAQSGRWVLGVANRPNTAHVITACTADLDADGQCDSFDLDLDGDGDPNTSDCAPLDLTIYTDSPELCDTIDSDCDTSLVDEFDDTDGDLDPDCTDPDDDNDGDLDGPDCDDTDPDVYTDAPEDCDTTDSDCDGSLVDEFGDADGDLDPDCTDPDDDNDTVLDGDDCEPLDPAAYPGAPEQCDAVDNDCDGSIVDEFDDTDGDEVPDCTDPDDDDDLVIDDQDCAPLDPTIYPGAPEGCDAIDSDCDGSLVDTFDDTDGNGDPNCTDPDDDGDSFLDGDDCAPLDGSIYPTAPELCDAVDSDCDGSIVDQFPDLDGDESPDCVDLDDDGDSYPDTLDCGPEDPAVYPNADEVCDLTDQDCDGDILESFLDANTNGLPDCAEIDADGDGDPDISDCAVNDPTIFAGAPELCDAIDSDCDGSLIDSFDNNDTDGEPDCIDADDDGDGDPDTTDCAPITGSVYSGAPEGCDGLDSDCDGSLVDEFVDTDSDLSPDCIDEDDDDDGDPDLSDCDDAEATVYLGAPEVCDNVDQDCDGDVVEDFTDTDSDGDPDCFDTNDDNDPSLDVDDCGPLSVVVYPGAPEACDAVDSDCDGDLVDGFDDLDGDGDPDCTDLDSDGDGDPDLTDCEPLDGAVFAGAIELCDDVDADCDGDLADGFDDLDGDGDPDCTDFDDDGDTFADVADCDPEDASVHPGATEDCDGVDSDCDGSYVDGFADLNGNGWPDCIDVDADGDGVPDDVDCNDADPTIYTGAPEVTGDGIDQDCNGADTVNCFTDIDGDGSGTGESFIDINGNCAAGATQEGDCDDADAANFPGNPEVCDGQDNDCSGAADADVGGEVDQDLDGSLSCADCDDVDPDNFPGNDEVCDGQDNDCVGGADADLPGEVDGDGDGVLSCEEPFCDDDENNAPGNVEVCDGQDNDCNGSADADGGGELDEDGDGVLSCADCDDDDPHAYPGFPVDELCDGVDNDCSGLEADEEDVDGDGWLGCIDFFDRGIRIEDVDIVGGGDCDDLDSGVWPGAPETSSDGSDRNCDGVFGDDVDGDGYTVEDGDCHDGDARVWPGAPEVCDGKDSDCDGAVAADERADVDGDGALACADCADAWPMVHLDAEEICDGRDSDCDGVMPPDELDADEDGAVICAGDCDDEDSDVGPGGAEDCGDGIDNDCDGSADVDEDDDGDGFGTCSGDCDDSDPAVHPDASELCNGLDDDCDGLVDPDSDFDGDGWTICGDQPDCDDLDPAAYPLAPPVCDDQVDNDCDPSTYEYRDSDGDGWAPCMDDEPVGDCWEGNPLVYPQAEELCDWIDNDCDGQVDEFLDLDEDGQMACTGDCEEGLDTVLTGGVEVCDDGLDGDCDGEVDEGCDVDSLDPVIEPPGCVTECGMGSRGSGSGGTMAALALLLFGLGSRRRRDRFGDRPSWLTLGLALLLGLMATPRLASAGPAEEVAMKAYAFQQQYCASVAGSSSTTEAAQAMTEVAGVLALLSRIYDENEVSFLLYWRGVLLQCVQDEERAVSDFEAFIGDAATEMAYPTMARDAERRLKILARKMGGGGPVEYTVPTVTFGVGGGYQLASSIEGAHHYGYVGLDVSIKLVGPLRIVVFGRPSFSEPLRRESGLPVVPTKTSVLVAFGVGPALRWEGPVRPGFDLRLQFAPNDSAFSTDEFLVGALLTGGLDIGLGLSPLALRPMAEVGFLAPTFTVTVRGGVQLVLAI